MGFPFAFGIGPTTNNLQGRRPYAGTTAIRRRQRHADPDIFAKALEQLGDLGRQLNGREMHQAVIHGDLTLADLLIDDGTVTGIDFENVKAGPVMRDLAGILTDYVIWFGQDDVAPTGALLSTQKNKAFWSGYGGAGADEDLLGFFVRMRLLRIWAGVPANPKKRSVRRSHVWAGIRAACARVFD